MHSADILYNDIIIIVNSKIYLYKNIPVLIRILALEQFVGTYATRIKSAPPEEHDRLLHRSSTMIVVELSVN